MVERFAGELINYATYPHHLRNGIARLKTKFAKISTVFINKNRCRFIVGDDTNITVDVATWTWEYAIIDSIERRDSIIIKGNTSFDESPVSITIGGSF